MNNVANYFEEGWDPSNEDSMKKHNMASNRYEQDPGIEGAQMT